MIDIAEQTTCKACGKPLVPSTRPGPRKKEYCNATCRQRAHRAKEQPNVTLVTIDEKQALEQRIAQLEREVEALKALRRKVSRDKLSVITHHSLQDRALAAGEQLGYPSMAAQIYVDAGVNAWRSFVKDESDKSLAALIIAAEKQA